MILKSKCGEVGGGLVMRLSKEKWIPAPFIVDHTRAFATRQSPREGASLSRKVSRMEKRDEENDDSLLMVDEKRKERRSDFNRTAAMLGSSPASDRKITASPYVRKPFVPVPEENLSILAKKTNQQSKDAKDYKDPAPVSFTQLGLLPELVQAMDEFGFTSPTDTQRNAIPRILSGKNVALAAETGSGKTLAYLLPVIQRMKKLEAQTEKKIEKKSEEELDENGKPVKMTINKDAGAPKVLVLVPTRELAKQVVDVAKKISYHARFSSAALVGGSSVRHISQRRLQDPLDIAVGTPQSLLDLKEKGFLKLHNVQYILMDEADVLLEGGGSGSAKGLYRFTPKEQSERVPNTVTNDEKRFAHELKKLVLPIIERTSAPPPQLVLAGATILHIPNKPDFEQPYNPALVHGMWLEAAIKKRTGTPIEYAISDTVRLATKHRSHGLPDQLKHRTLKTDKRDKHPALRDLMQEMFGNRVARETKRCMVFCNSIQSCRSTAHFLEKEMKVFDIEVACLHGELPAPIRKREWGYFTGKEAPEVTKNEKEDGKEVKEKAKPSQTAASTSGKNSRNVRIAVVTDIAARGLDPGESVTDVILFDLPRSWNDYLHRAGRTARANRPGTVTAIVGPGNKEKALLSIITTRLSRDKRQQKFMS